MKHPSNIQYLFYAVANVNCTNRMTSASLIESHPDPTVMIVEEVNVDSIHFGQTGAKLHGMRYIVVGPQIEICCIRSLTVIRILQIPYSCVHLRPLKIAASYLGDHFRGNHRQLRHLPKINLLNTLPLLSFTNVRDVTTDSRRYRRFRFKLSQKLSLSFPFPCQIVRF